MPVLSPARRRSVLAVAVLASGLEIVVGGTTDEAPSDERRLDGPDGGWAPVLMAWSDPQESPALAGNVAGLGGSVAMKRGGHDWYVTGMLQLDGPALAEILTRPHGHEAARAIVMHELGHLLGLGHVDDENELMHPHGVRPDHGGVPATGPGSPASGPATASTTERRRGQPASIPSR